MVNLGLMGMIPQAGHATPAGGLFSPPGFQTKDKESGDGDAPKAFQSLEEIQQMLRDGTRPKIDRAGEIESLIAKDKEKEWLVIFGPEGQLLSLRPGGKNTTDLPKPLLPILKGATIIHNHPSGNMKASRWDRNLIGKHGASKVIIVGPLGQRREFGSESD